MRYAIATGTVAALSGTTPGSGPAVLAERINGVITPVVGEFRQRSSVGQIGDVVDSASSGGRPSPKTLSGPSDGGDPGAKKNTVWTITPAGTIMGTNCPYDGSVLSNSTTGQLYPYYSFEDNGNDLSGRGFDLTATSAAYSSAYSVVGSKSAQFAGAGHFNIAHDDLFTASTGGGLRISFWYRVVTSPTIGRTQGIITKGSIAGYPSMVFSGEWGIFHLESGDFSGPDVQFVAKTGAALQLLTSAHTAEGSLYFFDFGINNDAGTWFVNVRGASTNNTSGELTGGSVVADTSTDVRIGNNTGGVNGILGETSKEVLIDAVSFSKDLTTSTNDLYNSGTGIDTGYDGTAIVSSLPSAPITLVTGTYQIQDTRNVYSAVTVKPAIKITKPSDADADIVIEVGTSTSKYQSDFTADPSVATVTQVSSPKGATVTWNGPFENHPIEISESDNGTVISTTSARASDCLVKATTIGSGAPNIGRGDSTQGPQDSDGTISSGAATRDRNHGEATDPVASAKALGYSPGAAITVRNPTGTGYSSGNVLRIEKEGNGWVIL